MYKHQFPRGEGPPRILGLVLIIFVVIGGIVGGVWYATRTTPKADPDSTGTH